MEKRALPSQIGVIACAVLEKELEHYARLAPGILSTEVLKQGLHDNPDQLRMEVQAAINRMEADERIQAIALLYGLCSRGVEGLCTERCLLVIPRAHDCITLLLGSKERYADYAARHPGTYWYSPGWIATCDMPGRERHERMQKEYVEKYGEDNGLYLMEMEQKWVSEYNRATFVDLGVGVEEEHIRFTRECADYLGWTFDRQQGDPGLLQAILAGEWDAARFLVVQPGETIRLTGDDRVIEARSLTDRNIQSWSESQGGNGANHSL